MGKLSEAVNAAQEVAEDYGFYRDQHGVELASTIFGAQLAEVINEIVEAWNA